MRMMKNKNNETVTVIGIDHGYGNMKTATRCFPSGVARYDKEPIFQNNLLVYNGMYYQIGEEHKEFCAEKTQDEDYYVLTLAAIAKELDGKGMNRAKVHIAAGLPLTWVATQKEDFQKYLLQNERVDFMFRNKEYHVEFAGLLVFLSDLVIHAIVNKKIVLKDWLLVISGYTGWKTSGGSFHVSITMINPDHHNCFIIVVFHHSHNHTSYFLNVYF